MFKDDETRLWVALAALALASVAVDCSGPEAFNMRVATGGQGGTTITGVGGTTGAAGEDDGGVAGTTGSGGAAPFWGGAGDGGVDAAAGTTGDAGTTGAAGTTGSAGMGGDGGTTGSAGTTGGAGTTGAAGAAVDGGVDASPLPRIKVLYECRQNGASVPLAEFSIKVLNVGTVPVALSNVSVRYWYTIDGTGAQAGTCMSTSAAMPHPCTISFQAATATKPTADHYAVISFASGTLAPGEDTGEIAIQIHGTGQYNQSNDYSFDDTGANFLGEDHVTGYLSGKPAWGTPP